MTTVNPVLEAYGDLRDVALATWGTRTVMAGLRFSTADVVYRLFMEGPAYEWTSAGSGPAWSGPKADLAAVILGNELAMAWSDPVSGKIRFGRVDLVSGQVSREPFDVVVGTAPALVIFGTSSLLMSFVATARHWRVTSPDLGESWNTLAPVPVLVDAGNLGITGVDLTNPAPAGSSISWAETDVPP